MQKPYATLSHNYLKIISDYCIVLTMILLFFSIISFGIMVMLILTDTQRRHWSNMSYDCGFYCVRAIKSAFSYIFNFDFTICELNFYWMVIGSLYYWKCTQWDIDTLNNSCMNTAYSWLSVLFFCVSSWIFSAVLNPLGSPLTLFIVRGCP